MKVSPDGMKISAAKDLEKCKVVGQKLGPQPIPPGRRWTVELGEESGGAFITFEGRQFVGRVAAGRIFHCCEAVEATQRIPGPVALFFEKACRCCC